MAISISEIMNKVTACKVLAVFLLFMSGAVRAVPFTYEFNLPSWTYSVDSQFSAYGKFGTYGVLNVTLDNGSNSAKNQTYLNSHITQLSLSTSGGTYVNSWSGGYSSYPLSSYFSTNASGVANLNLLATSTESDYTVTNAGGGLQLGKITPTGGPIPVFVSGKGGHAFIDTYENNLFTGFQVTGTQVGTPSPPTLEQLVRFAGDAYAKYNYPVAGYDSVPIGVGPSTGGFGAKAFINDAGNKIVLAFAGTDDPTDILADATFVNTLGLPSQVFRDYISSAAAVLANLKSQYPNAEITLTGHSLGGAVAQVLSYATGLSATTFNSPGSQQTISRLSAELQPLSHLYDSATAAPQVTNYRVYGDLVSTVGEHVGDVVTYVTPIFPSILVDTYPTVTMLKSHALSTVMERIDNDAAILYSSGPTVASLGESWLESITKPTLTDAIEWTLYGPVVAYNIFYIDPGGVDAYMLVANPGSPHFASVLLPFLMDMDGIFRLEEWIDDAWVSQGVFDELYTYNFGPQGVDRFRFFVLDNNTLQPPASPVEEFMLGVTFASDGVFTGTLTQFSSVPEPGTLILFATALACFGFTGSRKLQLVKGQSQQSHSL